MKVEREGEFVINAVPEGLTGIVQQCSEDQPPEVSEVEQLALELLRSKVVHPPRIGGRNDVRRGEVIAT